jgi:hypothetical protein
VRLTAGASEHDTFSCLRRQHVSPYIGVSCAPSTRITWDETLVVKVLRDRLVYFATKYLELRHGKLLDVPWPEQCR